MTEANASPLSNTPGSEPPGAWPPVRNRVQRIVGPVELFLAVAAGSGVILMIAAAAALVCANSPWHQSYNDLWHTPIGFQFGAIAFERDLHFWINDGLMTIFFF